MREKGKLIGIGLLLLPWIWWPTAKVPYEVPRTVLVQYGVMGLAAMTLWGVWKRQVGTLRSSVLVPLLLVSAWSIITSLMSGNFGASVMGNYYRGDGLITGLALVGLALVIGWHQVKGEVLLKWLAGSAIFVDIYSGVMVWFGQGVGFPFGNPHFLAGFLAVTLPALLTELRQSRSWKRLGWAAMALGHQVILALTGSSLFIGLALVVLIVWWGEKYPKLAWVKWLATAGFMTVFLLWVWWPTTEFKPEGRNRIWVRVMMSLKDRPVTGWGVAQVETALKGRDWPYPVQADVHVDKAHAAVMETLATTGIVGLGLYIWLWAAVITSHIKTQAGWKLILFTYLLATQLNVVSIAVEVVGIIAVGLALQENPPDALLARGR